MNKVVKIRPVAPEVPDVADSAVQPISAGKQTARRMRRAHEILAAARKVFFEKGFERTSVGEIAAQVGVVEGLVYSYFPTKRDLLNAVLRITYEPLIDDIERAYSRLQGLRSRLRFLVWRHFRVYVEEPGMSRLVLHEVRTSPDYPDSVLHDLHVRYTAFLMRTIREGIASGELPPDTDPQMIRSLVYGGIEHRMWGTLFGRETVDVEDASDRYTEMLLRGILPAEGTQSAARKRKPAATVPDGLEQRLARIEKLLADTTKPSEPPTKKSAVARKRST